MINIYFFLNEFYNVHDVCRLQRIHFQRQKEHMRCEAARLVVLTGTDVPFLRVDEKRKYETNAPHFVCTSIKHLLSEGNALRDIAEAHSGRTIHFSCLRR